MGRKKKHKSTPINSTRSEDNILDGKIHPGYLRYSKTKKPLQKQSTTAAVENFLGLAMSFGVNSLEQEEEPVVIIVDNSNLKYDVETQPCSDHKSSAEESKSRTPGFLQLLTGTFENGIRRVKNLNDPSHNSKSKKKVKRTTWPGYEDTEVCSVSIDSHKLFLWMQSSSS